jgi:hypothetical protein
VDHTSHWEGAYDVEHSTCRLNAEKVDRPQGGPGLTIRVGPGPPGRAATGSRDIFSGDVFSGGIFSGMVLSGTFFPGTLFRLILLRTFLPTPFPCMDVFSGGRGRFFRGRFSAGRFYRLPRSVCRFKPGNLYLV